VQSSGKWHLGSTRDSKAIHRGFDEALGFDLISRYLPYFDPRSKECHFTDPFDRYIWANVRYEVRKDTGPLFKPEGYLTDYLAQEAAKAIHVNKDHPFFMYMAFTSMHSPLQALDSDYREVEEIERVYRADPAHFRVPRMTHCEKVYAAMLIGLDRAVGTILKALEESGVADNTVVMFSNDNGAPQILRGLNSPLRGGKGTFFDGGIRVPFLLRWPALSRRLGFASALAGDGDPESRNTGAMSTDVERRGLVVDALVSHIDIFPTVMDAAGVPYRKDGIDGQSLIPILVSLNGSVGAGSAELGHESLFWRSGHYKAYRQGDWKVMSSARPDKKWLYNLKEDPGEMRNLADEDIYAEKLQELVGLMERENATHVKPLWPALSETPVLVDKMFYDHYRRGDEYLYWCN
jgi:arylsulfatase A-like enzyme